MVGVQEVGSSAYAEDRGARKPPFAPSFSQSALFLRPLPTTLNGASRLEPAPWTRALRPTLPGQNRGAKHPIRHDGNRP